MPNPGHPHKGQEKEDPPYNPHAPHGRPDSAQPLPPVHLSTLTACCHRRYG